MDERYNYEYYHSNCGPVPYEDTEFWSEHFGRVADHIVNELHPKTVLDAGCAMGYLVAALRDRGVEAYGVDISGYAISKVREDIKPYCFIGSLTEALPDGLPSRFDVVTNIEVLEHLYAQDSEIALSNLCSLTDVILFSSSPDDITEKTHFNVQQSEYWASLFCKNGFVRDLYFDAHWCSKDAVLFRRNAKTQEHLVFNYEHQARLLASEINALKERYGSTTQIVSVLIDAGEGYREDERIYSCHTPDTPYVNIGITVPAGGRTIRIEPVKGYSCLVTDVVVRSCDTNAAINLKEHNGIRIGESFLFENSEPFLAYDIEGVMPAVVQIIATVTLFPTADVCKKINRLITTKTEEMQAALSDAEQKRKDESLNAEKEKEFLRELVQQQKEQNQQVMEEMRSSKEEYRQKIAELQETKAQKEESEKKIEYLKKREKKLIDLLEFKDKEYENIQHCGALLKATQDRLTTVELEKSRYEAKSRVAEQQYQQTMDALIYTRSHMEAILNTKSWRITAPLRKFLNLCKGVRTSVEPTVPPIPAPVEEIVEPVPVVLPINQPMPPANTAADPADMLPESVFQNRMGVEKVVESLLDYDVISFDIFDTLVFRIFDNPTDVFRLLGHRLGEESFVKLRVQAEREARQHHVEDNLEVNIHEIYEVLSEYLKIDTQTVMQKELQAEIDCCFANPYLKAVFDALIQHGKQIILVSDMYWPKEFLEKLLDSCGYRGYAELFVSCDYRCNKGSGSLQKVAEMEFPSAKRFIHIGDNRISDIEQSQKMGWDTLFYQACRELGGGLRLGGMDRLSVSAYNSIVNTHLHADEAVYSPEYEHGFRYAGYLVCGFCEWLNKYAEQNNIDKILFLARDADILYKVYNKHFRKVDNEYVITSRLAMWEMAFESDPEDFIQSFFLPRANMGTQTFAASLEETDLSPLIPLLKEEHLSGDSVLNHDSYEIFRRFLLDHYSDVVAHYSKSKMAGQQYLREKIGDAKKVCAVDIGWSGQILIAMRKLVKEIYHGAVDLTGAYMAVTDTQATSGYVESGIITPYLFHGCMNRHVAIDTKTIEGDMHAKFMEATFSSDQRTLLKYDLTADGSVEMIYGIKNADAEQVHEIQKGVMDFADLWQGRTAKVNSYLQIMPADAKRIIDCAITNFRYCYAIFGDNLEWEIALPNFKGLGTITTLGNILKKRGLV